MELFGNNALNTRHNNTCIQDEMSVSSVPTTSPSSSPCLVMSASRSDASSTVGDQLERESDESKGRSRSF